MLDPSIPPFQHLYVHIPFCRRRCSYCDFAIAVRRQIPGRQFVQAVLWELTMRYDEWSPRGTLSSIYLGGGTPSLLDTCELERLFDGIYETWGRDDAACEVTIEVNPDDVDGTSIARWRQLGVNRVSLGVQSLQNTALEWMHRTHTANDALKALDVLAASGIGSVSVDVIFGLPVECGADPVGDVARLAEHPGVSHVSAYGLTIESGTPLAKWRDRGRTVAAAADRYAAEFHRVRAVLLERGFTHYEVSNYARPGGMSIHNRGYWTGASYLGVGPSAHSFAADTRWWNVRDWAAYDRLIRSGADPVADRERLDSPARWLETVYLGLRTSEGLDEAVARFLPPEPLERLIRHGLLDVEGGRVVATPQGWLQLDEIAALLTTSSEGG